MLQPDYATGSQLGAVNLAATPQPAGILALSASRFANMGGNVHEAAGRLERIADRLFGEELKQGAATNGAQSAQPPGHVNQMFQEASFAEVSLHRLFAVIERLETL